VRQLFEAEVFRFLLRKDLISQGRVSLVRSWRHSGFHLSAERTIAPGDREELERVLQYMERPPVSLRRLQYQGDGRVLYRGKYHPTLKTDHRLLSAVDFLALLVAHIALRYECRIHSHGAISSTWRRRALERTKTQPADTTAGGTDAQESAAEKQTDRERDVVVAEEDADSAFAGLRRRSWARLISKVWLDDPELCRACGEPMKIIAALTSPQQDAVIEKILRLRGEWAPPWLPQSRARSPPVPRASPDGFEYSQIEPDPRGDEYSQLEPSDDDGC
jgi:hypothetical protein